MKRRYIRDLIDLDEEQTVSRKKRDQAFTVSSLGRQQPLQVLESLIKLWPMHDLRYENSDIPGCYSTDIELMQDLVSGMELRILRRDLSTGTLECSAEFQSNLAEYERYNLVVQKHNDDWEKQGRPESIFDPVHGEVHKIKEKRVDPALITSSYNPQPKSAYSKPTGSLSKSRPTMKRTGYIRIVYKLTHGTREFQLSYVAYDSSDRVIYYNQQAHTDLAYLVRRSVQELWGNPLENGKDGRYLEGIPMLIQGRKLKICKRDNARPGWLTESTTFKTSNPGLLVATAHQSTLSTMDPIVRFFVPIGLVLGMIGWSLYNLTQTFTYGMDVKGPYVLGMLLLVGGLLAARKIAQHLQRKVSEIDATKRFI